MQKSNGLLINGVIAKDERLKNLFWVEPPLNLQLYNQPIKYKGVNYFECYICKFDIFTHIPDYSILIKRENTVFKSRVFIKITSNVKDYFTKKLLKIDEDVIDYWAIDHRTLNNQKIYLISREKHIDSLNFSLDKIIGWIERKDLLFWTHGIAAFDKNNKLCIFSKDHGWWYYETATNKWVKTHRSYKVQKLRSDRRSIEEAVYILNEVIRIIENKDHLNLKNDGNISFINCLKNNFTQNCTPISLQTLIHRSVIVKKIFENIDLLDEKKILCNFYLIREKLRHILSSKRFSISHSNYNDICTIELKSSGNHAYFDNNNNTWMNLTWITE